MALVRKFQRGIKERFSAHEEVECHAFLFVLDGRSYLQLDTYGRPGRESPNKISQSIQFDATSAVELIELLESVVAGTAGARSQR